MFSANEPDSTEETLDALDRLNRRLTVKQIKAIMSTAKYSYDPKKGVYELEVRSIKLRRIVPKIRPAVRHVVRLPEDPRLGNESMVKLLEEAMLHYLRTL